MADAFLEIRLERIVPSPFNPRKTFDPAALKELAGTIREHGVLEPIVVRMPGVSENYEIVMGERRWRASKIAGLEKIPAIIRDYTDAQVLEVIVIENNQRADVNAAEESEGFARILDLPDYRAMGRKEAVARLAERLGRSASYVWQRLKLADLTDEARQELLDGAITPGHAIILARQSPEVQYDLLTEMLYARMWSNDAQKHVRGARNETGCRYSVRELVPEVARKSGIPMALAPFALDDPFPGVGRGHACDGCPARTTTDPSSDETTPDACRDRGCLDAKCAAHVERRVAELRAAHPRLVLVSREWHTDLEGVEPDSRWDRAKEGDPKARPSVVVESRDRSALGGFLWTSRRAASGTSETKEQAEARKREEAERKRRFDGEVAFRTALLGAVVAKVPDPGDGAIARLAAQVQRRRVYDQRSSAAAAHAAGVAPIKPDAAPKAWDALAPLQAARYFVALLGCDDLDVQEWNFERPDHKEPKSLLHLARVYGVDPAPIRNEAFGQGLLFDPKAPPEPAQSPSPAQAARDVAEGEPQGIVEWATSVALARDPGAEVPLDYDAIFGLFDALIDRFSAANDGAATSRLLKDKNDGGFIDVGGRRIVLGSDEAGLAYPGAAKGLVAQPKTVRIGNEVKVL